MVEIVLYIAHSLRPLAYLLMQLAKLITWLTMLGLWCATISYSGYISRMGQNITLTTTFIANAIENVLPVYAYPILCTKFYRTTIADNPPNRLVFLAPFIYACVVFHRHRRARSQHRQRLFSLEEGKYPEVNEKTLARNVFPPDCHDNSSTTGDFHAISKYPIASSLNSPTLVEFDAGVSPMSPLARQELGDHGWVKELRGDDDDDKKLVHELGRESREVYELATVRTPKGGRSKRVSKDEATASPKTRSWRSSRKGSRKSSRERIGEVLSPRSRSRKGSRDELGAAWNTKARSRMGSRDELNDLVSPLTTKARSRKASRDELCLVPPPLRIRTQREDRRTMW